MKVHWHTYVTRFTIGDEGIGVEILNLSTDEVEFAIRENAGLVSDAMLVGPDAKDDDSDGENSGADQIAGDPAETKQTGSPEDTKLGGTEKL